LGEDWGEGHQCGLKKIYKKVHGSITTLSLKTHKICNSEVEINDVHNQFKTLKISILEFQVKYKVIF